MDNTHNSNEKILLLSRNAKIIVKQRDKVPEERINELHSEMLIFASELVST